LEHAIRDALDHREQVMLLMNRRGFAPFVNCMSCGSGMQCPRCRVALVYHYDEKKLLCHICHLKREMPNFCPVCSKGYLKMGGYGTEKVESEAYRLFPDARIARMDKDVTRRKGDHERILKSFRKREIDILLGTQMIAKGHDFPDVSVIGVISADTALHLPDFRSAERTFDLLTQVAGRAGRKDIRGKVYIQTFLPEHYAIKAAQTHDYDAFYKQEIKYRQQLGMPPWNHLIQVVITGKPEKVVLRKCLEFKAATEKMDARLEVLGPAPCLISKRYGRFLWNLYYKTSDVLKTIPILNEVMRQFDKQGISIAMDVDAR
jgi:primosomal protein N' (replication factor Y)